MLPGPGNTCSAPSGSPASLANDAMRSADNGVLEAGFKITELPVASDGAAQGLGHSRPCATVEGSTRNADGAIGIFSAAICDVSEFLPVRRRACRPRFAAQGILVLAGDECATFNVELRSQRFPVLRCLARALLASGQIPAG